LFRVDVQLFINCKLNTTTEDTEALCATQRKHGDWLIASSALLLLHFSVVT